MNQAANIEARIAQKTDLTIAGSTEVSSELGGISFKDMGQVMEFSKLMAVAGQAVPKHLRGQPGACLAVSLQALNWRMDPFAVANKSYSVNDRIAYEAQLIQAVVEQRAPIKGRIRGEVGGEGSTRKWTLRVTSEEDDQEIVYEGPEISKIAIKNSPLWKADPDQQLWYYSVRAMCRRHFPDVLLGVYEKDEIEAGMKDVTPQSKQNLAQRLSQPKTEPEVMDPEEVLQSEAEDVEEVKQDEGEAELSVDPFSKAYKQGTDAFICGEQLEACPYETGQEYMDWMGGYHFAENEAKG